MAVGAVALGLLTLAGAGFSFKDKILDYYSKMAQTGLGFKLFFRGLESPSASVPSAVLNRIREGFGQSKEVRVELKDLLRKQGLTGHCIHRQVLTPEISC